MTGKNKTARTPQPGLDTQEMTAWTGYSKLLYIHPSIYLTMSKKAKKGDRIFNLRLKNVNLLI